MSAQSRVVANRSAIAAKRVMISGKWSRLRRQRSSLVLCTVAVSIRKSGDGVSHLRGRVRGATLACGA